MASKTDKTNLVIAEIIKWCGWLIVVLQEALKISGN